MLKKNSILNLTLTLISRSMLDQNPLKNSKIFNNLLQNHKFVSWPKSNNIILKCLSIILCEVAVKPNFIDLYFNVWTLFYKGQHIKFLKTLKLSSIILSVHFDLRTLHVLILFKKTSLHWFVSNMLNNQK
jgi:hypothetical protein